MKKWIILIMLVLAISSVEAGFFVSSHGGSDNAPDAFFIAVNGFVYAVSVPCYPSWAWKLSACSNNSRFKEYYDIYSCGDWSSIPSDNSTYMSDCTAQEVENMDLIAIAILTIGFLFFIIYIANSMPSRTDRNDIIRFNVMLKIILYSIAAVTSFFSLQMAYGISTANGLNQAIESNLASIYQYVILIGQVILAIFGLAIIWSIYMWISEIIASIRR